MSIFRLSIFMSLGTLCSRFLGLARDIAFTALLAVPVLDAFIVAMKIPNLFRAFFGEGNFSVSFLPLYIQKRNSKAGQELLSNAVFSFLMLFSSFVVFFLSLYMPEVLNALLQEGKFNLVNFQSIVYLSRFFLLYIFFLLSYVHFSALLQVKNQFFLAALAPALLNVSLIVFSIFYRLQEKQLNYLIAGVLVGGALQFGLVFFPVWKNKFLPSFTWKWRGSGLKTVLVKMLPGFLSIFFYQCISLFNVYFASSLPSGSLSSLYLSDRIFQLPFSLIAISVGTALLPSLSTLWVKKELTQFNKILQKNLHISLYLLLPSAVGLFFLAEPILSFFFERGAFNREQILYTVQVLQILSFSLIFLGLYKVLISGFFACGKTHLPAISSGLAFMVYLALAFSFSPQYGITGLAFSMSVSTIINFLSAFLLYSMFVQKFHALALLKKFLHYLLPVIVMSIFLKYLPPWLQENLVLSSVKLKQIILLLVSVLGGASIYFFISTLLAIPEATIVTSLLKKQRRHK
ncbi:MAG: murein biosynthesis integral membrane protein MurJ [Bdellovibrionaceae bacterium]|nr:murein biosynthesis integral membrane protein MurJ [Pseudobdellovibrionaceae bacterium]